jgi:hypothetical protein
MFWKQRNVKSSWRNRTVPEAWPVAEKVPVMEGIGAAPGVWLKLPRPKMATPEPLMVVVPCVVAPQAAAWYDHVMTVMPLAVTVMLNGRPCPLVPDQVPAYRSAVAMTDAGALFTFPSLTTRLAT